MSELFEGLRRSKRNRLSAFDISRISQQKVPKIRKYTEGEKMANPMQTDPSIIDMSHTIMTNLPSTSRSANTPNPSAPNTAGQMNQSDNVEETIRDMVNESIHETQLNLRGLVHESVSKELEKVYVAIGKLNEAISSLPGLNRGRSETTVENNDVNRASSSNTSSLPVPTYPCSNQSAEIPRVNILPSMNASAVNKGIKIERFGLNFTGNPNSLLVDDFIYRLEYFQRQYKLDWQDILGEFHILLSGPALEWFWLQQRNKNVTDWTSLKYALQERYKTRRSCFEEMRDLLERKQMPGESIDAYFHDLNLMRSRLERPVSEYEMICLAKRNLRKSLSSIVYALPVSSLEQLRIECLDIEKTFFKKDQMPAHPLQNRPMRVNAMEEEREHFELYDQTDLSEEVAAINGVVVCWNCQNSGHVFRDCPASHRNLFCFKCGKPNTISPKCANCKSGNMRKNVVTAGNQRSIDQPAASTSQQI